MRVFKSLFGTFVLCTLLLTGSLYADNEPETEETEPEKAQYVRPVPMGGYHFVETFESDSIESSNWVKSNAKKNDVDEDLEKYDGKWAIEASADSVLEGDLGLVMKSKAKHSAICKKLVKPFEFSNKKPLVVQYEVKFQNALDCGGAYVKLIAHDPEFKQDQFHDKTGFSVMFGPDKCGSDNKYHFILRYKNPVTGLFEEKHAKKSQLVDAFFTDGKTHLFTLVVRPDNTFQMMIDTTEVNSGSLLTDMTPAIIPDKEIVDPTDKKPETWDDREKIEDPDASKPEDWDESEPKETPDSFASMPVGWLEDQPETIPDPSATRPDDWDDETDGEWEAPKIENSVCKEAPGCGPWSQPMISNPKYKGKWLPPLIENANYQGQWEPRKIANPDFFEEEDPFSKLVSFDGVGLELWSMVDNIYFDNFIITDDESVSNQFGLDGWAVKKDLESAQSSSADSVVDTLVKATKDKPWLWALYVLVVLVPVVLIFVFCCGSSKSKPEESSSAEAKKTDAVTPDDEVEVEEKEGEVEEKNEDDQEEEEEEEEAAPVEEEQKPSKSDLEDEVPEEKPSPKKTTTKRRTRKD
jgi:calnexin